MKVITLMREISASTPAHLRLSLYPYDHSHFLKELLRRRDAYLCLSLCKRGDAHSRRARVGDSRREWRSGASYWPLEVIYAAGIYAAAYRIIDVASIPIFAMYTAASPQFFRSGESGGGMERQLRAY